MASAVKLKAETYPEEVFIKEAIREDRCKLQDYSMKALGTPDTRFQARVEHINLTHRDRLVEGIRTMGKVSHPVVVFEDPNLASKRVRLADGFHRHAAYKLLKMTSIPAYVVKARSSESLDRETLEYATMCNRLATLGRKPEDTKKAVLMLLEDIEWFRKSSLLISNHVGCSKTFVSRLRVGYCEEKGLERPDRLEDAEGRFFKARCAKQKTGKAVIKKVTIRGRDQFLTNYGGKKIYLGANQGVAEKHLEDLNRTETLKINSLETNALIDFFSVRGLVFSRSKIDGSASVSTLTSCYGRGRVLWCSSKLESHAAVLEAVGKLVVMKGVAGNVSRLVVISYPDSCLARLIKAAEKVGIEFMTPEEFVDSLKSEESVVPEDGQLAPDRAGGREPLGS